MSERPETPHPGKVTLVFFALLLASIVMGFVGIFVVVALLTYFTENATRHAVELGALIGVMPLFPLWRRFMHWYKSGMSP